MARVDDLTPVTVVVTHDTMIQFSTYAGNNWGQTPTTKVWGFVGTLTDLARQMVWLDNVLSTTEALILSTLMVAEARPGSAKPWLFTFPGLEVLPR